MRTKGDTGVRREKMRAADARQILRQAFQRIRRFRDGKGRENASIGRRFHGSRRNGTKRAAASGIVAPRRRRRVNRSPTDAGREMDDESIVAGEGLADGALR